MWSRNHFVRADLVNCSPRFFSQHLNSLYYCCCFSFWVSSKVMTILLLGGVMWVRDRHTLMSFEDSKTSQALCSRSVWLLPRLSTRTHVLVQADTNNVMWTFWVLTV